jgi:hypothetical protein
VTLKKQRQKHLKVEHLKQPLLITARQGHNNDNANRRSHKMAEYISYWGIAIFLISLLIFTEIIHLGIKTDIQGHIGILIDVINKVLPHPGNFLYYLTVYTIALFSTNFYTLCTASIITLSLAVTAKYVIAHRFAISYYQGLDISFDKMIPVPLLCMFSIFAFSLPTSNILNLSQITPGEWYLGQIPPNVWHNSTTIFLMPFALLLFWISYKQFVLPTKYRILAITILCILNIVIKPNFYFVFCLMYPLMLFKSFGLKKEFWLNLIPLVIGSILLAVQYYLIYKLGFTSIGEEKSGVGIGLFTVWSILSTNIVLSLLASILFPLAFLCVYWRDLLKNMLLQYAFLSFFIAVIIFCVLIETGPRLFDGNFFWQCVVCNYILFLVVSLMFYEKIRSLGMTKWYNTIISVCYVLQVVSGFVYLFKVFTMLRGHLQY